MNHKSFYSINKNDVSVIIYLYQEARQRYMQVWEADDMYTALLYTLKLVFRILENGKKI